MRIEVHTIDQFLHVLEDAVQRGGGIYNDVVHYDRTTRKIGEGRHDNREEVNFSASAVLDYKDGSQALLQCGVNCGTNVVASDGHTNGNDKAGEHHLALLQWGNGHDVRLLPGIIHQ